MITAIPTAVFRRPEVLYGRERADWVCLGNWDFVIGGERVGQAVTIIRDGFVVSGLSCTYAT